MADLRERFRAIESARPPDLWGVIDARARETHPEAGDGEVVGFRTSRVEWRRRAAAVLAAAAVFVLGSVLLWRGFRSEPPLPPQPADVPAGWVRCTNGTEGYSIGYPADWYTTDVLNGERDPANACRWFDTQPFDADLGNIVAEGFGFPLEVRIRTGGFETVVTDETNAGVRVLSQEAASVEGRRAVRLEVEFLDGPIVPARTRLYEYVVELGPERTLLVLTADQEGIAGTYEDNRLVVDDAFETLHLGAESDVSPTS